MKRLCFFILVGGLVFNEARAAVISRDWKTPDDGLLTYDDVNRREWLDLTESKVTRSLTLLDVLAELNPGGALDGFQVAHRDDVLDLASSAGVDLNAMGSFELSLNQVPASNLIALVGNLSDEVSTLRAQGTVGPFNTRRGPYFVNVIANEMHGQVLYIEQSSHIGSGVWLYRPVSEPSVFCLGLALAAMLCLSRESRLISFN